MLKEGYCTKVTGLTGGGFLRASGGLGLWGGGRPAFEGLKGVQGSFNELRGARGFVWRPSVVFPKRWRFGENGGNSPTKKGFSKAGGGRGPEKKNGTR